MQNDSLVVVVGFFLGFVCFTKVPGSNRCRPSRHATPSEPPPAPPNTESAVYIPQSNIFSMITNDAAIWDKQNKDGSTVCSQSRPGAGARESEGPSPVQLQGMFPPAWGLSLVPHPSSSPPKITLPLPLLGHRVGSTAQQRKKPK